MTSCISIDRDGQIALTVDGVTLVYSDTSSFPVDLADLIQRYQQVLADEGAKVYHAERSFREFTHLIMNNGEVVERPLDPAEMNILEAAFAGLYEAWLEAQRPSPSELVNFERDRRVRAGRAFDVSGYGSIHIRGTETDIRNLQGLAFAAQMRIAQGDTTTLTPFRDDANVIHMLTSAQVIDLWSQGAAYVTACFQAAWNLKDNPPIPDDYTEDKYWP